MAPFFYIFVPIFSSFLLKGNGVSQRHMEVGLFFLASASMFLLLGFRGHDVGTDTPNYYLSFFRIGDAESYLDVRYEPAYVFLSMAIDSLGFGPEIMIAACSLIICLVIFLRSMV